LNGADDISNDGNPKVVWTVGVPEEVDVTEGEVPEGEAGIFPVAYKGALVGCRVGTFELFVA
jgi:hypothetical protein